MSWSKVKYFFFDTPEEKEAAQYSYEKEQTDMKKQQDPQNNKMFRLRKCNRSKM